MGAWGCFDEFNRLEEDVLSAVSQQIQIIQGAIKERAPQMTFMHKTVDVDHNAGIFVTMNPAGKGYGGRSKLPDNLKQLFRSVAMTVRGRLHAPLGEIHGPTARGPRRLPPSDSLGVIPMSWPRSHCLQVPDNELIAEVLLLSEGFQGARDSGRKLSSLFSLAKQLLSPQQHYDWGLRALKTVLGIAGGLLHKTRAAQGGTPVRSLCPARATLLAPQASFPQD